MNLARILICLIVFLSVTLVGGYAVVLFEKTWEHEQALHLDQVTRAQSSAIERRLNRSLSATYLLALEVRFKEGKLSNFENLSEEIIKALGGISNLQLAPDGVIRHIYPLAGNEKALGHNLLKDDKRRKEAHQAIQERKLTLAGPFKLIQGGIAVIGRNPVFINRNGEEEFWGFASALIFLEDLLAVTDLTQLEKDGYQFELTRKHPDTGEWEVFAKSKSPLHAVSSSTAIAVPNSQWKLALSRPLPNRPLNLTEGLAISLLVGGLLAMLLAYILREPERLRKLVEDKTRQLNELAFYDVLTGLVNRRLFIEQIEHEVKLLQRTGKKAALMYLDLDDFKKINDTLGHSAGDQLLVEVAHRLKSVMRESDIICRLGGDEYAVLMMNIESVEDCQLIADKIIASIGAEVLLDQQSLKTSISIGITIIPDDSSTLREMLNNADLALYESKNLGKNRATFFNHDLQKAASERLILEQELRFALSHKELELHYQPIIRLNNRKIVMLEALIRWRHPEKGMIPPIQFIEVAEQCGLIIPIGEWVLEEACKRISESLSNDEPVVPIAVNISAKQLTSLDFAAKAISLLEQYEINPAMIEMEITESVLMENVEVALCQLNELRAYGCRFSIDDFGTGYSSLAQLKQLPVDTLKIDRSFVRDIEVDHHDRQIVEAIIAMSHRLGLNVVGEGVETQAQLDFIDRAGCDLVQGYLFSKPVPYEMLNEHEIVL